MKNKKIKICFFSIKAYPLFNKTCADTFGGAEIQLYQLAKKLSADDNFKVSFFVADVGQRLVEKYGKIRVVKAYPLQNRKKRFFGKIYHGIYKKIVFLFKLALVNPDICIHRAAGIETGILAFYCKFFGKKFIYMTAHEFDCSGEYEKKNKFSGKSYAYGIRNASMIITQNREHQKLLKENYGLESVILKSNYEIPEYENDKKSFILWVARLDDWKQPEIYINLAKEFPGEKLIMVAPIANNNGYAEKIVMEARKVGNIELIPGVPFEEIGKYFKKSRLFINTSRYEGFPNTFVQAAMFGTPIISLSVNPDNFLNEWNCGYCAEGSEEKLRQYVGKLLTDESDWQEKSKNAYRYAKENHDMEKNIKKLKEIIFSLSV